MIQSNFACIVLAVLGLFNLNQGVYSTLSTLLLIVDAYIGAILFSNKYSQMMNEYGSSLFNVRSKLFSNKTVDEEDYTRFWIMESMKNK